MMWAGIRPAEGSDLSPDPLCTNCGKNISEIDDGSIAIEYADHCYRLNLNGVRFLTWICFRKLMIWLFQDTPPSHDALVKAETALHRKLTLRKKVGSGPWAGSRRLPKSIRKTLENDHPAGHGKTITRESALYYIQKWAALDVYKNQDHYISWVENNIGKEAAKKLESIFSEDE